MVLFISEGIMSWGSSLKGSQLDGYFKIFWNEVKRRFSNYDQDRNVFNALPYFFFLMSEIIANHGQIILSE